MAKKRFNSKQKGSSFERQISKSLSLWLSNGERDDLFWRTQSSGGRHTIRRKKQLETINQDGDITSTHDSTKGFTDLFSVEAKAYKDLNLWALFTSGKADSIQTFWDQAVRQAKSVDKIPILIAKQNNRPILWCSNYAFNSMFYTIYKISPKVIAELPTVDVSVNREIFIYLYDQIINLDSQQLVQEIDKLKQKGLEL